MNRAAGSSFGHVGRATATALGDHRVLHLDPLAHLYRVGRRLGARQAVVLLERGRRAADADANATDYDAAAPAVPPQERLVVVAGSPAVHAGRHRARDLALGTVALEQPPRPEPLAQVLPLPLYRAHGLAPQVLLDFPAQLSGYPGPKPPATRQREIFGVHIANFHGHFSGGHQPSAAIPSVGHIKKKKNKYLSVK